jgi:hypothetical protein
MAADIFFLGIGVLVTMVSGFFCECFLQRSVTADPGPPYSGVPQEGGGGKELGVLERLIFFSSLWNKDWLNIAGAWLVFKAAGKWAAWQHIVKTPSTDHPAALRVRIEASARLLGRWLNGTLYNGLCAFCGFAVQKLARYVWNNQLFSLSTDCSVWAATGLSLLIIWMVWKSLFTRGGWPRFL